MGARRCFFCSSAAKFSLAAMMTDEEGNRYVAKLEFVCRDHLDEAWERLHRLHPGALIHIDHIPSLRR